MSKHCVLAQHGISIETNGNLQPCCQFRERSTDGHESYTFRQYPEWRIKMDSLAQSLDNGIEDPRCYHCWHDEELGYASLRTTSNDRYNSKNINEQNTDPWHVEFKLGNFCNLRCIMCSPHSSSSIWAEFTQNKESYGSVNIAWGQPDGDHKWWESQEFVEFCNNILPSARYLHFSGGEPFMVPGLAAILAKVPDPSTVDLLFVTNMTIIDDTVLSLIKSFNSISFAVSLEGHGKHNDYVRHGSDFSTIEKNLEKIKNIVKNRTWITINHTFQHTSIYALPALIDWCHQQNYSMHFSLYGGTEYMKINSVPPGAVDQFNQWIAQSKTIKPGIKSYIIQVLKNYQYDRELYIEYRHYTNMLDSIRGNSFSSTFLSE